MDVEFHPNSKLISSATKSEPSDKATSNKAIPVNKQCDKHHIIDIIIQSTFSIQIKSLKYYSNYVFT